MGKIVKIFIACGSGIATSTVAEREIKRIAANLGVRIRTSKGTIGEIPGKQLGVDLICTTANYRMELKKPSCVVGGLVSGIKKAQTEAEVERLLIELSAE